VEMNKRKKNLLLVRLLVLKIWSYLSEILTFSEAKNFLFRF